MSTGVTTYSITASLNSSGLPESAQVANVTNINGVNAIVGSPGVTGATGATGAGVSTGGTAGQVLAKNSSTNYDDSWQTLAGLGGMTIAVYDAAGVSQQVLGTIASQTATNKRITKRSLLLSANSATPAINTDNYDVVNITAQTAAITSFTSSLAGTPLNGDTLRIAVTGTAAVGLTFGSAFEASAVALPTTTVATARLDMGFFWNPVTSKWRIVALA
jgi:hypothetical protein